MLTPSASSRAPPTSTPPIVNLVSMNAGTLRYSEPKVRNSACSTTSATASVIISTASCDLRIGRIKHALDDDAEHRHQCDCQQRGGQQRQLQLRREKIGAVGAERVERAVGQVQDPGHAENQREPYREHGVDGAAHRADDQDFEQCSPRCSLSAASGGLCRSRTED